LNLSCPLGPQTVVEADPVAGTAVESFEVPKVLARLTTTAAVLLVSGAAATTALPAPVTNPVTCSRPNVSRVVMSTDELEDRLRDDLLVHEEKGVVGDGAGAQRRPNARSVILLVTRLRPPHAGQAVLAAPVIDEALLEEEDVRRAPRHPGVEAPVNMEAAPMWYRQDVRRGHCCFMVYDWSADDALLDVRLPHSLRANVGRLQRDAEADVAKQPGRVGRERRNDHEDDEYGEPQ
jgi:hypothetical protein